ncbi:MAG: hypothetical protein JWO86_6713 [Myxococcaceae bacterium]|nr:hypothetical protein [Myxococcaceae bacterium]
MKPANATVQDDIPPVHVLEAAQNQDRKETEDLLAGFDRPGRGPKPVSKERDFVDYYARKKPGSVPSGGGPAAAPIGSVGPSRAVPRQGDVSTVIVPRKGEMPPWLGWAAAAVGMLLVGGAVAYLATADGRPSALAPTAPSAATTITSATSPVVRVQENADTNIPPPAPAEPTTTAAVAVTVVDPLPAVPSPRSSAKRDARGLPSAAPATTTTTTAATPRANATDDTKPPPRDDFIRDL